MASKKHDTLKCNKEYCPECGAQVGIALVSAEWDGDDQFSRGMRLLKEKIIEKCNKSGNGDLEEE